MSDTKWMSAKKDKSVKKEAKKRLNQERELDELLQKTASVMYMYGIETYEYYLELINDSVMFAKHIEIYGVSI